MMKSLLLNEWISFRHSLRGLAIALIAVALPLLIPSFMEGSALQPAVLASLFSTLAVMIPLFVPLFASAQAFASEEKSHWGEALSALPSAPRCLAASRYLFCLISLAPCFAISLAAVAAAAALEGTADAFFAEGLSILPAAILCFALVLMSFIMPLLYAFGQKGLAALFVFPALVAVVPLADPGFASAAAGFIRSVPSVPFAAGIIAAALALYALSCLISSAILKRRSF